MRGSISLRRVCRSRCSFAFIASLPFFFAGASPPPTSTTKSSLSPVSPAIQKQADDFLAQLASGQLADGKSLQQAIDKLDQAAYAPLHAALMDPKQPKELHAKLEDAVPALLKKLDPRKNMAINDRKWEGDFERQAYDQHGLKSPKWDDLVHAALDLWTASPPENIWAPVDYQKRADAWQKPITAGCNDPLVVQLYLAAQSYVDKTRRPEFRTLMVDACDRLENSTYPPLVKLWCYCFTFTAIQAYPQTKSDDKALLTHFFDQAMLDWEKVVKTPDVPDQALNDIALSLMNTGKIIGMDDEKVSALVIGPLRTRGSAVGDLLDGNRLLALAWDRRGGDWAGNVDPARMRSAVQFAKSARQSFEKSWLEDPTNVNPPTQLIRVELLDPIGRNEMEKWYQRAIAAWPDSIQARAEKLNYLLPRWYGSYEELVAFGHECLATKNWKAKIPQLLVTVHQVIAQENGKGSDYFATPAVWKDLQDVFEAEIKNDPHDMLGHSWYAYYAAITGHKEIARTEFGIIGKDWDHTVFGSQAKFDELAHSCGVVPPASTNPAGAAVKRTQIKDQLAKWGGEHVIVKAASLKTFASKLADDAAARNENFQIFFGPEGMKSGKMTALYALSGQLFSFELSPEQAKLMTAVTPKGAKGTTNKIPSGDPWDGQAKIQAPVFDAKGPYGPGQSLKGKVTCKINEDLPAGAYIVRLRYFVDGHSVSAVNELKEPPAKGTVTLPFDFPIFGIESAQPTAVFIDLVRIGVGKSPLDLACDEISDPAAVLVDFAKSDTPTSTTKPSR